MIRQSVKAKEGNDTHKMGNLVQRCSAHFMDMGDDNWNCTDGVCSKKIKVSHDANTTPEDPLCRNFWNQICDNDKGCTREGNLVVDSKPNEWSAHFRPNTDTLATSNNRTVDPDGFTIQTDIFSPEEYRTFEKHAIAFCEEQETDLFRASSNWLFSIEKTIQQHLDGTNDPFLPSHEQMKTCVGAIHTFAVIVRAAETAMASKDLDALAEDQSRLQQQYNNLMKNEQLWMCIQMYHIHCIRGLKQTIKKLYININRKMERMMFRIRIMKETHAAAADAAMIVAPERRLPPLRIDGRHTGSLV